MKLWTNMYLDEEPQITEAKVHKRNYTKLTICFAEKEKISIGEICPTKWEKYLQATYLTKGLICRTNSTQKSSGLLPIGEMQIRDTRRHHLTPVRVWLSSKI